MNLENRNYRYTFLHQIRKDKARKLYNEKDIYILPKSLNPFSTNNQLIKLAKNCDFDEIIKYEINKHFYRYRNETLCFFYIDGNIDIRYTNFMKNSIFN